MGYAVLHGEDLERLSIADCGVIGTPKDGTRAERLVALADTLDSVIRRYGPRAVAVERLFFNRNVRTAMAVSEARGVALVCAARAGVPVFEYTPHQVKLAVTGYGRADKKQVQQMLALLLRLAEPIRQDDTADAVAVALCHAQGVHVEAAIGRAR
jgi:crossover junction endodeoxyribonuclease RuvC